MFVAPVPESKIKRSPRINFGIHSKSLDHICWYWTFELQSLCNELNKKIALVVHAPIGSNVNQGQLRIRHPNQMLFHDWLERILVKVR